MIVSMLHIYEYICTTCTTVQINVFILHKQWFVRQDKLTICSTKCLGLFFPWKSVLEIKKNVLFLYSNYKIIEQKNTHIIFRPYQIIMSFRIGNDDVIGILYG